MIMISENAALRRTLSAQKGFFVMIAISKNVRILFSVNFSQCDLDHKHDQCECDSITGEGYYASHNRVDFSLTFYCNRNLIPQINNKSLYPKVL